MIIEQISQITTGQICKECGSTALYKYKDQRVKCKHCEERYFLKTVFLDLWTLYYFSIESTANKTSNELKLNYRTVLTRFNNYRRKILQYQENNFRLLSGEIECDESYFGGHRKYLRGRSKVNLPVRQAGKIIVLGLLERKGKIYTTIVENVKASSLLDEIKMKSDKSSVFFTDKFKSYKSLQFFRKHIQIDHQEKFVDGRNHINGIEGFWSYAKERLLKYHGVSKHNFILYLKELEFRFNYRKQNIFNVLIDLIFENKYKALKSS